MKTYVKVVISLFVALLLTLCSYECYSPHLSILSFEAQLPENVEPLSLSYHNPDKPGQWHTLSVAGVPAEGGFHVYTFHIPARKVDCANLLLGEKYHQMALRNVHLSHIKRNYADTDMLRPELPVAHVAQEGGGMLLKPQCAELPLIRPNAAGTVVRGQRQIHWDRVALTWGGFSLLSYIVIFCMGSWIVRKRNNICALITKVLRALLKVKDGRCVCYLFSAEAPSQSTFLPHVNGLRAIAIIGILLYHLKAAYCPAGYFGVDIFLVMSGYFLFTSLVREHEKNRFHYGQFLLKKAWRILPSWFVCTIVVCALSAVIMLPGNSYTVLDTAKVSAFFGADYYIDWKYDYFDQSAHTNALLHYWYLSITQQFYIIAPLLLIPLWRYVSRTAAYISLFILALLSLVYYVWTTSPAIPYVERVEALACIRAHSSYYHLIPRFWELTIGFFLVSIPSFKFFRMRLVRDVLSLAGLGLILWSFYRYATGSQEVYMAIVGALLVMRYGDSPLCSRILSVKWLQWVGTISFSLYLWHWPIITWYEYFCLYNETTIWDSVVMTILSLLCGYFSWRWIESMKPIRGDVRLLKPWTMTLSLPLLFAVAWGAERCYPVGSTNARKGFVIGYGKQGPQDEDILRGFETDKLEDKPIYCGTDTSKAPEFLLIGDSHSLHLYDGVHQACTDYHIRGIAWNNMVTPFWGTSMVGRNTEWIPEFEPMLVEYLNLHPTVRHVIISMKWTLRMPEYYYEAFKKTLQVLKAQGVSVILVMDTPDFPQGRFAPFTMYQRAKWLGYHEPPPVTVGREEHYAVQRGYMAFFKGLKEEGLYATIIDLAPPLLRGDSFPCVIDGEMLYTDRHHLTKPASMMVGKHLIEEYLKYVRADSRS